MAHPKTSKTTTTTSSSSPGNRRASGSRRRHHHHHHHHRQPAEDSSDTLTVPKNFVRSRRQAVSSESVAPEQLSDWEPPVYPKTPEEREQLREVVKSNKLNLLFGHLRLEDEEAVINAMFMREVPKDTDVIRQGDQGDNFYIVAKGRFDIFVTRDDSGPKRVMEAGRGMSFGELALMYNAPRAATCTATEDSVVWALDRQTFQIMLVTKENTKKKGYENFIENIDIFKCLTKYERSQLSDIMTVQTFKEGEVIIRQDDKGDKFYVVESGEAVCKMKQDDGPELEVYRYEPGGFFGELALISASNTRKASVYAAGGTTTLLWIDKPTFDRVLGPIIEILRKHANQYPTYAQLLKGAQTPKPVSKGRSGHRLRKDFGFAAEKALMQSRSSHSRPATNTRRRPLRGGDLFVKSASSPTNDGTNRNSMEAMATAGSPSRSHYEASSTLGLKRDDVLSSTGSKLNEERGAGDATTTTTTTTCEADVNGKEAKPKRRRPHRHHHAHRYQKNSVDDFTTVATVEPQNASGETTTSTIR